MSEVPHVPIFFSQRLLLALLSCLGTLLVYVTRVNLSVAIICMVRADPHNDTLVNISQVQVKNMSSQCQVYEDSEEIHGTKLELCHHEFTINNINPREPTIGEFDWDKQTRSQILAMYYYGYVCTQVLSGWLASRYGGTRVWGVSMFICGLATLLTPICARTHVYLAFTARIIVGISSGVSFPCIQAILGQWVPVFEKSKLASIIYSGISIGNIITFSVSGLMCQHGFDNGWGSIFYLSGIFTLLWVVVWFILTADTPSKHRWISESEQLYIEAAIGKGASIQVNNIPWIKMLTCVPLWAAIVAHFCNNYVNYTLLSLLPTFLKESLNFDIKQNGLLSSLPYISELAASLLVGFVSDTIRSKGLLSTRMVRKTFQVTAFIGLAVCMVSVAQVTCEVRHIAVMLLCLNTAFMSFNRAGYVVNHQDLAPGYAGILYGLSNTAGTVPGMIAPLIAGALTPNKSTEEWKNVFYVCAANALLGAIVYVIFAKGELQEWAVPKETKLQLDIVAEYTPGHVDLKSPNYLNNINNTEESVLQSLDIDTKKS